MKNFKNKTAVITGAGSGFGLEFARIAAGLGMNLVLADVQPDALDRATTEMRSAGAQVLDFRLDVSKAADVDALGAAVLQRFGAPHLVFNNAGVASGGLIWESSAADWEWVIGVNLMGVANGIRVFVPMMLDAARQNADYRGHVVNTASMAGLVSTPNMGVYTASKHAVISMSETLYHDLSLVTSQVSASVLCPFFVPTGIAKSERNRPGDRSAARATQSQLIGRVMLDKAVTLAKVSAAEVAQRVFEAVTARQFYIYSHPKAIGSVQSRLEDIMLSRNPTDPFAHKPELGESLRQALRSS